MIEPTSSDSTSANDAEILQQVERELRLRGGSQNASKAPFFAFGIALFSCLSVGALAVTRLHPVEAARPTPRWVNWTYSFEEAQARAAKSDQKILIDFYTDWCPSCKAMDARVWTKPDVLGESQNAVMAKINTEIRPDLAKRYNIRVLPTLVWTDASGTEVARHNGSAPAGEVAALMAQNR